MANGSRPPIALTRSICWRSRAPPGCKLCGHALAKAHARSGDAIAIASYVGSGDSFDRALASFAEAYADQNESDYDALRRAGASGRVTVQTEL